MSSFTRALGAFVFICGMEGANAEPRRVFDRIVAVVDHDPVLLSELDRATHPFLVVMEAQIPDATKREEARLGIFKETLDKLVDKRLVERAAMKKGVRATD